MSAAKAHDTTMFPVGTSKCDLLEDDKVGHDKRHAIKIVTAADVQDSAAVFYKLSEGKPIIVKGVFDHDDFLSNLNMDVMRRDFAGQMLQGYNLKAERYEDFKAEDVFEDIALSPDKRTMSIVDHPIEGDTQFATRFRVPGFFQENWFNDHKTHKGFVKSIFFSGKDNFTAYHVDPWGMQGWMFLAQGRKYWELTPPAEQVFIFDPIFKDFYNFNKARTLRASSASDAAKYERRFPHRALASRWCGLLEAGDFMYIPPGWVHQVWTYEAGFGVGGAVCNHFPLADAVYSHLFNRSFSIEEESLSVKDLLRELAPAQLDKHPETRPVVAEQLALIEAWEKEFVAADGTTTSRYATKESKEDKGEAGATEETKAE